MPAVATSPPPAVPDAASSAALVLRGVTKVYRGPPEVRAVDGLDLEVAPGELFGLLGPNGAGKSTTVGICTTRIRPTDGHVEVVGVDAARDPAGVKRRVGVVTQDNTLDRSLTAWETLYHHCRYFGWAARESRARADELLARFRLTDRAAAFPSQLSGGMAQRLQVARAVAHRPELLFLDEPTAGLDPQSRIALWELVQELRGEGLTVLLTTHYMEEADALCDRVAIVDHGRVLVCDPPERLKAAHGQGGVVDVTFAAPPGDDVVAAVRGLDEVRDLDRDGDRLRIRLATAGTGGLARVVAAVDRAEIRDVAVTGASLEAVFIELTGRDLRE
jgi:ABC-2 type transport system ATP-binding protein